MTHAPDAAGAVTGSAAGHAQWAAGRARLTTDWAGLTVDPAGLTADPARLTADPAEWLSGLSVSFWLPTLVLGAALALKLPSIVKMWRDPLLRAVGGLLLFGCAVFVFAAPGTIAWTNRVTGVPNISAPWVYSLLTALSASWLLLIIAWRNGLHDRSEETQRATRWVVSVYAGVVVTLWILFWLADAPVERLQDLDTYYATTPFMREQILLYLTAHTVACAVTARLIWNWIRTDGLDAWLRAGLRFLGVGYASNLFFDASKLTAVVARWAGRDLDWLSTYVAPSAACVSATLVAVGFIIPHAGQYLHEHWRVRREHRRLRPLYRLMRTVTGRREPYALRTTAQLRLIRRETFIRDGLLQLARYLDEDLRDRSHRAALALGRPPARARALAAAVTILAAVDARERSPESEDSGPVPAPAGASEPSEPSGPHGSSRPHGPSGPHGPSEPSAPDTTYLLREIQDVSRALRRPDDIEAVRARATALAESVRAHE